MKTILMFLLAMTLNPTDFFVDQHGDLVWEHIYETDMTSAELHKSLYISSCFTDIERVDDTFYLAKISGCKVDYEKYGFKRMQIPICISNNNIGLATAIIQYKEGKYKVTIKHINLASITSMSYGKLRDYAVINRRQLDPDFKQYLDNLYHPIFENLCKLEKVSDNW